MNREDDRPQSGAGTAGRWYVETDAERVDARRYAELTAWLASEPEHEAELERCEAALFLAKKLGEQARMQLAFDEAARLAAGPRLRGLGRPAWYAHPLLAWGIAAVSLTVAVLAMLGRGPLVSDDPAPAPMRAEARHAMAVDLATSQPAVVLPGDVVVDARSVAVLPFADETAPGSDGGAARAIAAALYDDVVRELETIPGIYLVGRDTVVPYAERETSVVEVAAQLGVRAIIEARVGHVDGRIRVVLEFTDAAQSSGSTREIYERPLEELAALPPDIVADVAIALDATLRTAERLAALQR